MTKLVNSSGAVVADYTYDAFGNQTGETEDSNPFRYAGEYWDSESGLIYLRARYYDSGVGAFVSEDPAKDGLNWYVYANNNAINFFDPFGLAAGDFLINGNKIGYVSKWGTGTYGSARDIVEAMGGYVSASGTNYTFNIGTLSFTIDNNMADYSYGKADVYNNGSKIGTVQYTKVPDQANEGYSKLLIQLDDITSVSLNAGYGATYEWDLGDEGGTLYQELIAGHLEANSYIPKAVAVASYNPDSVLVYGIGEISPSSPDEALGDFLAGLIYGIAKQDQYNDYLENGQEKFLHTVQNTLTGYANFGPSDISRISVYAGSIGYFKVGDYIM